MSSAVYNSQAGWSNFSRFGTPFHIDSSFIYLPLASPIPHVNNNINLWHHSRNVMSTIFSKPILLWECSFHF